MVFYYKVKIRIVCLINKFLCCGGKGSPVLIRITKRGSVKDIFPPVIQLRIFQQDIAAHSCVFFLIRKIIHTRNTDRYKPAFRLAERLGKERHACVSACGDKAVILVHLKRLCRFGGFAALLIQHGSAEFFERAKGVPDLNDLQILFMPEHRGKNTISVQHDHL